MTKRKKQDPAPLPSPEGFAPVAPGEGGAVAPVEYADPLAAAFGGLFALTPAAESIDPGEAIPQLERVAQRLTGAKSCRDQVQAALKLRVTTCLTKGGITANRCKDCVDAAMRDALRVAHDCCNRNRHCVEMAMANALSTAWATAEKFGCKLPGATADKPAPTQPIAPNPGDGAIMWAEYDSGAPSVISPILGADGAPIQRPAILGEFGMAAQFAAPAPGAAFAGADAAIGGAVGGQPGGRDPCVEYEKIAGGWRIWNDRTQVVTTTNDQFADPVFGGMPTTGRAYKPSEVKLRAAKIAACQMQVAPQPPPQPRPIVGPFPQPIAAPVIGAPPPESCPIKPACPEPQPDEWRAWYSPTADECYVTSPGEAPRLPGDDLLYQGPSVQEANRIANQYCAAAQPGKLPHPKPAKQPFSIDWCDPRACLTASQSGIGDDQAFSMTLPRALGLVTEEGEFNDELFGKGSGIIGRAVSSLLSGLATIPASLVQGVIEAILLPFTCQTGTDRNLGAIRAALGLAETLLGDVAADASQSWEYLARYRCPQLIPGAADATAAYLSNAIDRDTFECWVRANNQCFEPWLKVLESRRSKPGTLDLAFMRRRGWIDATQYDDGMRALGYLEPSDRHRLFALTEQVPPVSDLIRFMSRDADDVNLVQKFGLDSEFDVKWGAKLKEWAAAQGVTEEQAKYNWRAHWSIPSPGQLYTFYQRFRKDPQFWHGENPLDVIKTALSQQDILPYWQDLFIESSFRTITLTDASGAFDVGAMTRDELVDAYSKVGYSDENAETLAESRVIRKNRKMRTERWVKLYRAGGINRAGAEARLLALGYDQDGVALVLDEALAQARADSRAKCVVGIKRRMFRGEFDAQGAQNELVLQGVDFDQASALASGWACERAAKGKVATAANLCRWFEDGLITLADMVDRLEKLGWSRDDAVMLATDCLNKVTLKQTKAQEAAARKAQAAANAAAAKLERSKKATDRALKQAARARQAMVAARERREQMIVDAAQKAQKKLGVELFPAITEIRRLVDLLRQRGPATLDEAIQAVVDAVESAPKVIDSAGLEGIALQSLAGHEDVAADVS